MKIELSNKKDQLSNDEHQRLLRATSFELHYQDSDEPYIHSHVAIPALGDLTRELFYDNEAGGEKVDYVRSEFIELAQTKNYALIRVVMPERPQDSSANKAETTSTIYQASYDAYRELAMFLAAHSFGTIVRIWNYVPNILTDDNPNIPANERERYRQFNAGRFEARQNYGPYNHDGSVILPAATVVGSHGGPLLIECLVTQNQVTYIDNPRQTPPHNYPTEFGSKPPAFARGALVQSNNQTELYISGTASIVGSSTVHHGDAAAQVKETFTNIKALIGADNMKTYQQKGFVLDDIVGLRVYIKDHKDYLTIRKEVEKIIGTEKPVVYVNDDICRPDLLLEIEGVAQRVNH